MVTDKGTNTYVPGTIYATNGTFVYVTKNHGVTWLTRTPNVNGGTIEDIAVNAGNRDTIYAVVGPFDAGNHVFVSTNAGQAWTNITYNLPDLPTWTVVDDPRTGNVYVGTDDGVWLLPAGTTTWVQFGANLADVQVHDLQLNQSLNTLTAGTYGRGVWEFYLSDPTPPVAPAPATQPVYGALRATSGSSIWTGPVQLIGAPGTNSVVIAAAGDQAIQGRHCPPHAQHRRPDQRLLPRHRNYRRFPRTGALRKPARP